MALQDVRGYFERLTADALAPTIDFTSIVFDNYGEEPPVQSTRAWATISLAFDGITTDVVGCQGGDDLRGSLQCTIYTPKNTGAKGGEDLAVAVLAAWHSINLTLPVNPMQPHTRNQTGPMVLAQTDRPWQATTVTCGFRAKAP